MSDTEKSAQAQPNESAEPSFRYNAKLAQGIEEKWQKIWDDEGTFWAANVNGDLKDGKGHNAEGRPSYFAMDMFPYPSGKGLHVGHPLGYLATDVVSRYHRMKGENVLHAMGYDAFGLPAEQYAVQTGQHPRITTEQNIANMRRQLHRMGLSFDNRRSFATIDPGYVRWTQWIFSRIYDAWYDEQDAAQLTQPVSLYLLGTDGEEHPLDFHWTVADGAIAKVQNGIVYLLSPGGTVTQMNLSTGSSTTQSFDLPGQAVPDDPDILPGNWASVYITDLGNGDNECLLNLDTGEFQPQPTTWFKDQAAPRCPIIWAADHGMLFLQYGEVYYTEKGIGPDGLPASYTVGRNEYGIISFDDYLAGSQDWVHVTLLGDDFA